MSKPKIWIKALRAPFFTATIAPVFLGTAIALNKGPINPFLFVLTLIGAVLIHGGINLLNDYFDYKTGADQRNVNPTPFSGGSRVIQEGYLSPKSVFSVAMVLILIGGLIGFYLNYICGSNTILLIGIAGVFLGFFYTAGPLRLGYHGFGEFAVGIGFGPLIVLGSYFVQARFLSLEALFSSMPAAILIALVLFINEFPDRDADSASNKRNLVVVLGKERSRYVYIAFLILCYFIIVAGVTLKIIPVYTLISLITLPIAFKAITILMKHYNSVNELIPANLATIRLHLFIVILLAAGFVFDKFI